MGETNFCRIGAFAISPDENKLAYSADPDGTEVCTTYIKDLVTGDLLPEQIPNTSGRYDYLKEVAFHFAF